MITQRLGPRRSEWRKLAAVAVGLALVLPLLPQPASNAVNSKSIPARALEVRIAGDAPPAAVILRVRGPKGYQRDVPVNGTATLRKLQPGRYRVRARPTVVGGITYTPTHNLVKTRVTKRGGSRVAISFRKLEKPAAQVAPATPPPPGVISDVLARINAARAAGTRCDGTPGPALPSVAYSSELAVLAQWHADDFAAGRAGDFLADLTRSGFSGTFVGESAVVCSRVADPDGVFAAMRAWDFSCGQLFDPRVDRIGIGYVQNAETTNAWVLTFGTSTS